MHLIAAADYRRMRWKNDLGWTSEIALSQREHETEFDWRVSIAEIESDCTFSAFSGFDRSLLVLDGNGIELKFDQAPAVTLRARERAARFAGEWQTSCRLLEGATRDFNVMTRRCVVRADILHRPLVDSMWFPETGGMSWLVYMLAGTAQVQTTTLSLSAGDSLLLESTDSCVLAGGGEVLLVKFTQTTGTGPSIHS